MFQQTNLETSSNEALTIRYKFRCQKRQEGIKNSFREKRERFLKEERDEMDRKRKQIDQSGLLNGNKQYQFQNNKQKTPQLDVLVRYKNYLVYNEVIGSGTYSKVYMGYNLLTNQKVAVKEISELEENQIRVLMSVDSPFIIKLESYWKNNNNNLTYLVLDLCERNLRQQIGRGIDHNAKMKYFDHIIKGMDALFSKNIIHRDLKFENILVSKSGIAKITDFGLAKDMGMMSQIVSLRCGTPYTMAPQIFFHNQYSRPVYNQKCDIWSIGILLHQILYKCHPFNLKSENIIQGERVRVHKKFGYLDLLIDRSLINCPNRRISWSEFKKIYDTQGCQFRKIENKVKKQVQIRDITNLRMTYMFEGIIDKEKNMRRNGEHIQKGAKEPHKIIVSKEKQNKRPEQYEDSNKVLRPDFPQKKILYEYSKQKFNVHNRQEPTTPISNFKQQLNSKNQITKILEKPYVQQKIKIPVVQNSIPHQNSFSSQGSFSVDRQESYTIKLHKRAQRQGLRKCPTNEGSQFILKFLFGGMLMLLLYQIFLKDV